MDPRMFVLTQTNTITIITAAGAWIIDKKTGKVKGFVPEKGFPGGSIAAFEAGANLLHGTESQTASKAIEELRNNVGNFLVSTVAHIEADISAAGAQTK